MLEVLYRFAMIITACHRTALSGSLTLGHGKLYPLMREEIQHSRLSAELKEEVRRVAEERHHRIFG
jgi:hypothetical protein